MDVRLIIPAALVVVLPFGLLTSVGAEQSLPQQTGGGKRLPPPVQLKHVKPVYPKEAMEGGVQGNVILDLVVAPDGTVTSVQVRESIPALDNAAMAAVRQWVYAPYVVDGKRVPITITVTVYFKLTQTGRGPDKNKRESRPDALKLARTAWRCTTVAKADDPPRQGYIYFHPNGDVKMAQVVPEHSRGRTITMSWWRSRDQYDAEDPTGRKWIDTEWVDDGNIWASRHDQGRIIYGSRPGLLLLSVPKSEAMNVTVVELVACTN